MQATTQYSNRKTGPRPQTVGPGRPMRPRGSPPYGSDYPSNYGYHTVIIYLFYLCLHL